MSYEIINSDCLKAMQKMPDGSVDAIVTDPPYGLAFMGAKWDSFNGPNGKQTTKERQDEGRRYATENKGAPRYGNSHGKKVTRNEMVAFQEAMTPIFAEALRVAKPGAHMLCFGGTRTFHRLACSLEDAGWEIRDCIMWVTGQGFPKSMDVSKAIEKKHGADAAAQWDGWGTCLKPAWEPIIVARKPLDGTVAHNVLTWGVGALNIDACRVPTSDELSTHGDSQWRDEKSAQVYGSYKPAKRGQTDGQKLGRFPANLVHDGSQLVLDLFPQSKGQQGNVTGNEPSHPADGVCYGEYNGRHAFAKRGDTGSAARFFNELRDGEESAERTYADKGSTNFAAKPGKRREPTSADRFFYCAKASKKDRGDGNDHPTVKPNALMRWLVRLVCPQGGTVLDPFMGSGSTGVACIQEGMRFVGIEMDEHYCEIAEKRIGAEPDTAFAGALWASM